MNTNKTDFPAVQFRIARPISEYHPVVVKIPPEVMHGSINLDSKPCVLVNAVLRNRPVQERDYIPQKRPFPYDIAAAKAVMAELNHQRMRSAFSLPL